MSEVAVAVKDLSKKYTIRTGSRRATSAREAIINRLSSLRTGIIKEDFWALKDINFEILKGQVVGVIGRNGAGKSTLLKVLSRISEPTTGRIELYGRTGSLLEVGTGFHPDLTGRENIFLNGAILGMRRPEIRHHFSDIVEFAGVEKFVDEPVKRYSSGMYVRLAFAVAAHLKSEILVVDEVLAVGDIEFQKRCLGKIKSIASDGRTILFVSHQMQTVLSICDRAIYLEHGECRFQGEVQKAVEYYASSTRSKVVVQTEASRRPGSGALRISSVLSIKECYYCDELKAFKIQIESCSAIHSDFAVSVHICNEEGIIILQCDSITVGKAFRPNHTGDICFEFESPWLKPGLYTVDCCLHSMGILDFFERACVFEVLPALPYENGGSNSGIEKGVVLANFQFKD